MRKHDEYIRYIFVLHDLEKTLQQIKFQRIVSFYLKCHLNLNFDSLYKYSW